MGNQISPVGRNDTKVLRPIKKHQSEDTPQHEKIDPNNCNNPVACICRIFIGSVKASSAKSEQTALRSNVKGYVSGANFDLVFYRTITK